MTPHATNSRHANIREFYVLIFTISGLFPACLSAQVNLRLAPSVGLQTLSCYVKENAKADSRFRTDNFGTTSSFGINLQLDINNSWMFFAGWSTYKLVVSYKYGNTGTNRLSRFRSPAGNFPFGIQKTIGTHKFFKINESRFLNAIGVNRSSGENAYLLLFRSSVISGASSDLVNSVPGNFSSDREVNFSIFVGLGFQFFSYSKDRLQLIILYSQGLREITSAYITYRWDGKAYSGIIGSKGSHFSIQLAYPLQLAKLSH